MCELLAAMDVHHLVVLPEMYTDLQTGELNQPAELTAEQWRDLVDGQSQLGKASRSSLTCSSASIPT